MCRLKTMYMMILRILFVVSVGFLSVSACFAQINVGGRIQRTRYGSDRSYYARCSCLCAKCQD